ncbi:MAG: HD-GYP domain-containing protein [Candidatus Omnitrophica bacterium]|nr:HD-GYP domain-containing protein [Candidatus Omnitrophota bacterium]
MNTKNYLTPTKRYKNLISTIHSIYRLVNSTYELSDLIPRLCRLISQILSADYCQITMLDATKGYSVLKCFVSGKNKFCTDQRAKIVNRIEKQIIRNSSVMIRDNFMAAPLISDDLIGIVILRRKRSAHPFEGGDRETLMTLIEQAIIGIRNLQLYEEQQKIVFGSIKSLVTLLDTRVPQEYTHSPYFSRLVTAIGHQMRLDEKQLQSLKYASLLHDTGKVDIPPEILTKTTKLTAAEFNIIKKHPVKGAQILRPLQVLRPVIPIIMHHHEKYDGTGYPSRLKKGQIPEGARIMAVADAFEAMVYGRPYRERKDINSAIREIKKKSGTQFDPRVVDAFLKIIKKINTKVYLKQDKGRK